MPVELNLSICIVNWNTRDYLESCLRSLETYPANYTTEIIVVDNASTDDSVAMVQQDFPNVRLIQNTANFGYAKGNNQAVNAATGAYILLLNPDIVVHPNSLTDSMEFILSTPNTASLGCRLISPDGTTQMSVRGFPDPCAVLCEYLKLWCLAPKHRGIGAYRMRWFDYSTTAKVDQPMGSYLLISRSAWETVGPLDEQFPIFFNEVDWCERAKRQFKFDIWYSGSIAVTHFGGGSTKQVRPEMIRESHRSLARYYDKHYSSRSNRLTIQTILFAILLDEFAQVLKSKIRRSSMAQ